MITKIVSYTVRILVYICAISILASLSVVPLALAAKFILWLF